MVGLRNQVVTWDCWEDRAEVSLDRSPVAGQQANVDVGYNGSEQPLRQLAHILEREIIPRLMLAHRNPSAVRVDDKTLGSEDIVELARLVLAHDGAASTYVETIRAEGASLETIYLDLLAPAARYLGELWEADLCDFTEVTVGLWRLQQVLRELSPAFQKEFEHRQHGYRVLLAPTPGEQHTFGLAMVAEFFRRAGWDVLMEPAASGDNLFEIVRSEWFDVVGLSVSCESQLEALTSAIRVLREASRNRALGVLVGGRVFIEHPEFVAVVGADGTAVNGRQAALQAENLLAMLARC